MTHTEQPPLCRIWQWCISDNDGQVIIAQWVTTSLVAVYYGDHITIYDMTPVLSSSAITAHVCVSPLVSIDDQKSHAGSNESDQPIIRYQRYFSSPVESMQPLPSSRDTIRVTMYHIIMALTKQVDNASLLIPYDLLMMIINYV